MANEAILTAGQETINESTEEVTPIEQSLLVKNNLGDLQDIAIARRNLKVPSVSDLKSSTEILETKIVDSAKSTASAIEEHINGDDPHGDRQWVESKKYIKQDGSTKFTSPQSGVYPTKDEHLVTRAYVKEKLEECKKENNPEKVLPQVTEMLEGYLKQSETVAKNLDSKLKSEINGNLSKVARIDITNAFLKPQIGVYPTSDIHLSTKKYVDDKVSQHITSVDPHGFITILNQRLAKYAKSDDVLSKSDTYSRTQIDNEISRIADEAIRQSLSDYKNSVDNRFEVIRKAHYVQQDGSVSFKNPQAGVEATDDNHLVIRSQVQNMIKEVYDELSDKIKKESTYWITSGPVQTTVGFLEDESRVPEKMSIQEVLDSIFYGKKVSITSPETGNVGETVDVVVCITGDLSTVDIAYLYQNDTLIRTIQREEFEENGCVTVTSDNIDKDTEFRMDIYYSNDAKHSEYSETKLAYPIFVGILPEWYFGTNVTYKDLEKLAKQDPVNNKFYDREAHLRELTHQYNFDEEKPVKLILALPRTYPDLKKALNGAQEFSDAAFTEKSMEVESFSFINVTPFTVNNTLTDYKLYIYNQPLVRLDSEITFKF